MTKSAISVEHLSKSYRLGQIGTGTLAHDLNVWWAKARGKPNPMLKIGQEYKGRRDGETIWALLDVSFTVQEGEVLGIIGRNGAGKSTLLKILSRVTAPSEGRIRLKGRVASLLEVGTGFHPELTGRENIFLNGAILGMSRQEIDRKFEQIVAFAEVEKFIDTPVKRYSSGMYVRLAFAVAAHLDAEILIVDEVLAVGDAEFQKKCLGKMGDVASKEGRTVLFVSHNMISIQNLCSQTILLENGKIKNIGDTKEVINRYLQTKGSQSCDFDLMDRTDRKGNQSLLFTRVELIDSENTLVSKVISGQDVRFRFYYKCNQPKRLANVHVSFVVRDQEYPLTNINSIDNGQGELEIFREGFFECDWPNFNLTARTYDCSLFCAINNEITDWIDRAFLLEVEDGDFYHSGKLIGYQSKFLINYHWKSKSHSNNL